LSCHFPALIDVSEPERPRAMQTLHGPAWFEGTTGSGRYRNTVDRYLAARSARDAEILATG
jgi:hypothetical protein